MTTWTLQTTGCPRNKNALIDSLGIGCCSGSFISWMCTWICCFLQWHGHEFSCCSSGSVNWCAQSCCSWCRANRSSKCGEGFKSSWLLVRVWHWFPYSFPCHLHHFSISARIYSKLHSAAEHSRCHWLCTSCVNDGRNRHFWNAGFLSSTASVKLSFAEAMPSTAEFCLRLSLARRIGGKFQPLLCCGA